MFSILAKDEIVQKVTTFFLFTLFMLQFYIILKKTSGTKSSYMLF